jgi:hypothetical protein
MYGVQETTVYLPEDLKLALEQVARSQGRRAAELVREALRTMVSNASPPRPRLPLFESGDPDLAERVDEALAEFGDA